MKGGKGTSLFPITFPFQEPSVSLLFCCPSTLNPLN